MTEIITVKVKIVSAHKLIKRSILRNPDPFAQISLNSFLFSTPVLEKTANPVWNISFNFDFHSSKDKLELIIWNNRLYSKKKASAFLGTVLLTTDLLDLGERRLNLSRSNHYPSKPVRGFVKVEMMKVDNPFIPYSLNIPHMCSSVKGTGTVSKANENRSSNSESSQINNNRDRLGSIDESHNHAGPSNRNYHDILLPVNFERKVSDGGKVYFVDNTSGTIHWYHPGVPKCLRKIGDFSFLGPLPPDWDSLQSDSGRIYFIDHISRTTQYTDPRLISALQAPNSLSVVIQKHHLSKNQNGRNSKIERSRSDRRKLSNTHESVMVTLKSRLDNPEENNSISAGAYLAHRDSTQSRDRSQSSIEILTINETKSDNDLNITSVMEDDNVECNSELAPLPLQRRRISRPTSNYVLLNKAKIDAKLRDLRLQLKGLMQKKLCIIETSRDNILEESYTAIKKLKPFEMQRRLVLKFTDEEGLDYGGVAREWLYLLSETLFSCRHGLFETNGENNGNLLRVSTLCWVNENNLEYFHFIGRIIGMAIFHGYYIDADFCKLFYKSILNRKPKLEDFKELDQSIYNSFNWILTNNIDDADLNLTFSLEQEVFGELQIIDLCENGRNVPVTDNLKKFYVERYVEYNLVEKCADQYSCIKRGIYEVLPQKFLDCLNEDEFEVLLTGISEIRIEDWQKNTRLKHCLESEPLIKWFWEVVTLYTEEQRTKLLQFVTGSSRIPLSGFEGLRGSYGSDEPKLFTIKVIRNASPQSLPKAHTCFNRLDLPPYTSCKSLQEKLTCAIEETCGFAVM